MDKYLIYILLIALLGVILIGFKVRFRGFNDSYLSIERTISYKGIFAVIIILPHLFLKMSEPSILSNLFRWLGSLAVCTFFFISGYGLMKNNLLKADYKENFLIIRLSKIVIPYLVMTGIYWIYNECMHNSITFRDILMRIWDGSPIVENSWYIIVIIYLYISFYLSMQLFNRRRLPIILFSLFSCIGWWVFCTLRGFGGWWYQSTFAFVMGITLCAYEDRILEGIKKKYWTAFSLALLSFLLVFLVIFKFEPDADHLLGGALRALKNVLFTSIFVMAVMKFDVGNAVTRFLGRASFEVYMIHGLVLSFLRSDVIYIESNALWVLLTLILSFAAAYILHYAFSLLLGALLKPFKKA